MKDRFKQLPSPSMGVAFVALLLALGGTAVALPGKNGVKSDDIAKNAVRSSDIKSSNVGSSDVKNNALTGSDVDESKLGKVPSATSADTATTATSATTATTATNATALGGTPAASHLRGYAREFPVIFGPPGSSPDEGETDDETCATGKRVIGGGGNITHAAGATEAQINDVVLKESYPIDLNTWRVTAVESDPVATDWRVSAIAICVNAN